jgi:hypothetical protein
MSPVAKDNTNLRTAGITNLRQSSQYRIYQNHSFKPTWFLNAKLEEHDHLPENNHVAEDETRDRIQNEEMESEYQFDSLDIVLDRARNRKMVLLPYQIQAITNKPLIPINFNRTIYLTVGELALLLVALKLGAYGFSIGYVVGKGTREAFRNAGGSILLVELWTVFLAVSFDIIWNNVFYVSPLRDYVTSLP